MTNIPWHYLYRRIDPLEEELGGFPPGWCTETTNMELDLWELVVESIARPVKGQFFGGPSSRGGQ